MNKINFKVRVKNAYFWLTLIPTVISFIYTILAIFDIVPGIEQGVLIEIATAIISALSTLGILLDPTTEGIFDSARALTYDKPAARNPGIEEDGIGE
jgi:phi LC3 family holin